jgi:hypothetical protein
MIRNYLTAFLILSSSIGSGVPRNQVTFLLFGNNGIYGFEGGGMDKGKKYDYKTVDPFLIAEKKKFSGLAYTVIISASPEASYKNVVDMLDKMKTNHIEKYALVDITKEQAAFVQKL